MKLKLISPINILKKSWAIELDVPEGIIATALINDTVTTIVGPYDDALEESGEIEVEGYFVDKLFVLGQQEFLEDGSPKVNARSLPSVVNSIIDLSFEDGHIGVTKLELNKILYFVQAAFLMKYQQVLFNDTFSKGGYGPYIGRVNSEYYTEGSCKIQKDRYFTNLDATYKANGKLESIKINPPEKLKLPDEQLEFFTTSVKNLLNKAPWELVERTRAQSISECDSYKLGIVTDYKLSEIIDYFKSNPQEWVWLT